MISDSLKKKWMVASQADDFHIYAPESTLLELRIHDDVPSMIQAPIAWNAKDLTGSDAVFMGIPWEGAVGTGNGNTWSSCAPRGQSIDAIEGRRGGWEAPDYIRKCSTTYNIIGSGGFYPEVGPDFRLLDHIEIMDYGNVPTDTWDAEEMSERAIEKTADIVRAGAVPLVFGGDHAIPYPVLKAISDNTKGKTGIIWFDRHYDVGYGGKSPRPDNSLTRLNAENAMYRILESCNVDPEKSADQWRPYPR